MQKDKIRILNSKKNNKGITLIALIITIIVMLILVGVSVTVALNGGLFDTAQKAVSKTQIAEDKEMLFTAAFGAMKNDATVDFDKLNSSATSMRVYYRNWNRNI